MKKFKMLIALTLAAAMLICVFSSLPVSAYSEDKAETVGEKPYVTSLEVVKVPDKKMMHKIEKDWFEYSEEWDRVFLDFGLSGKDFYNFCESYAINPNMAGAVIKATFSDGEEHELYIEENYRKTSDADSTVYTYIDTDEGEGFGGPYSFSVNVVDIGDFQARVELWGNPEVSTVFTAKHIFDKKLTDMEIIKAPDKKFEKIEKDWFFIVEKLGMKYLDYERHGLTYEDACEKYLINKNMKGAIIRFTYEDGTVFDWKIENNCEWVGHTDFGFYSNEEYDINLQVEDLGDYTATVTVIGNDFYKSFSREFVADGKDSEFVIGDANGDGEVDVTDATEIQKYVAELADFSDAQLKVADVNGDGGVDVADATAIQRIVAKLI